MLKVPRCMSTQHPDNVNTPFFAEHVELGGEDEIQEAYYAYSHLGVDEQMWDCEGKEVDNYVVKKLLAKYEQYFWDNRLGKDKFLTLRVPNPKIEKTEAKILLETLESIPRSFDAAKSVYDDDISPIIEVILPMTETSSCIDRVYSYYKDFIVGKQHEPVKIGDVKVSEWIGEFKPEKINVIPLFEDWPRMLNSAAVVEEYLKDKNTEYQRVFLARSDPAMNYGLLSAVLLNKIALQRLYNLSEKISVDIFPIIGVGSAPFRGNMKPQTVDWVMREYPSVHTFTIQSAFKYDNSPDDVRKGVETIRDSRSYRPQSIEEEKVLEILKRYADEYQDQIMTLAPIINDVSKHIPSRRKRKLHIGLFGYSRKLNGEKLPRAKKFTASLYSLGIPPEILGLNALSNKDLDIIQDLHIFFKGDLRDSLQFYNKESSFLPEGIKEKIQEINIDYETDTQHLRQTKHIINSIKKEKTADIHEYVLQAANRRRFLG